MYSECFCRTYLPCECQDCWEIDETKLIVLSLLPICNSSAFAFACSQCSTEIFFLAKGDSENRGPFLVGPREILQTLESMQDARSTSSTAELVRGLPTSQQILLFAIWDQSVELSKKPVLLAKPNQKKQPLKVNSLKPRITSLKPSMTKRKREHMKMSTIYCR